MNVNRYKKSMLLKFYFQSLNYIFVRSKPVMHNLRSAYEFFATHRITDKNIFFYFMQTKYYALARFYLFLKKQKLSLIYR